MLCLCRSDVSFISCMTWRCRSRVTETVSDTVTPCIHCEVVRAWLEVLLKQLVAS